VAPDGGTRRGGHHQQLLLHLGPVRAGGRGLQRPSLALAPAHRLPPLLPLLPLLLVRGTQGSGRPPTLLLLLGWGARRWMLGCLRSSAGGRGTGGSPTGDGMCGVGAGTPREPPPFPPRLFVESARWQVISGRPDLALKGLRKVARVNAREEEGDKLSEQVRAPPDPADPRDPPPRHPPQTIPVSSRSPPVPLYPPYTPTPPPDPSLDPPKSFQNPP